MRREVASDFGIILHLINVRDNMDYLLNHFKRFVLQNYRDIINRQTVYEMVNHIENRYPMVIQGVVPERISYRLLKKVLVELLERGYALNNLIAIIEIISDRIDSIWYE